MANLMQRLLRNQSCLSAIPKLTSSLITCQKPWISNVGSDPASLTNPVVTVTGKEQDNALRFYPSFSIGNFLNPNGVHCLDLAETTFLGKTFLEEKEEKETVIYADSVKKKRKKKMNKHKYRKLRKSLSRKT